MSKKNIFDQLEGISDMLDGNHQVIPIISSEEDEMPTGISMPDVLPILTLRSSVLFPGAITPITVGRDKSMKLVREVEKGGTLLGAVLQKEASVENPGPDDLYGVGTAAKILKVLEMPNGNLTVILHGVEKFEVREFVTSDPFFKALVSPLKDLHPAKNSVEMEALIESVREVALNIVKMSSSIPQEATFAIKNIDSNRGMVNFISSNIELPDSDRQALLEAPGLVARARKLLEILIREQQLIELKNEIQSKVKEDIDQQQREYFLHQQMRTIQEELGGNPTDKEVDELREKAEKKKWTKEVAELFEKEMQDRKSVV